MSKWIFNDCEFEYDFDDMLSMQRYEEACKYTVREFSDYAKKLEKEPASRVEDIQFYYDTITKFFEMVFDDKTVSIKLFNGTINKRNCIEAYESFITYAIKSIQDSDSHLQSLASKYGGKKSQNNHNKKPYHNRNKKKRYA